MSLKKRIKLLKQMFDEVGIDKKVLERLEDKCISMSNLMFSHGYIIEWLNREVKGYLDENERFRFNFVNIAEKYDFDISFLED